MKIKDAMTPDPYVCAPDTPLFEVASRMRDMDVGMIPVCDGVRIQGVVTDRDIVVRAVAEELDLPKLVASDVMTDAVTYCFEDDDVAKAAGLMETQQIRRLIVLDREKNLVGILSLGDLATKAEDDSLSGETLEKISESPNAPGESQPLNKDDDMPTD